MSPARACCFLWVSVFMLAVTLPGWDCVRMHACIAVFGIEYVWQMKRFLFCIFFGQLIRLWLQVCEEKGGSEKEMFGSGSSPDPRGPPEVRTPGH